MPKANLPYYLYRFSNFLYRHHFPIIPKIVKYAMRIFFCTVIPYETQIGKNVHFGYNGLGVVIHKNCIIGNNVLISQLVTIGGRKGGHGFPTIGDDVSIGAGAKLLGEIKIGHNAKIGANAVVLKDVPSNGTAIGVPARIVRNGC